MNAELAVRRFREADIAPLVRILTANGQYDFPEVEGPEAMRRGGLCSATVFQVAGCIRMIARLIHLLSVITTISKTVSVAPRFVLLARKNQRTHGRRGRYRTDSSRKGLD